MQQVSNVISKIRKNGLAWAAQRFADKGIDSFRQINYRRQQKRFRLLSETSAEDLVDVLTKPSDKPFKVHTILLENTTYCNLRCPGCFLTTSIESGDWKYEHMEMDDYKTVLQNLPASYELSLHNYGEPSIHPDFPEMVELARDSGKFDILTTTSNLTVRNGAYYDKIFEAGLSHLSVSVDSFDPELAEKLRTRTNIKKLKTNLTYLISRYADRMHVATVVSKSNLDDLRNTYEVINEMAEAAGQQLYVSMMKFDVTLLDELYEICLTEDDYAVLNRRVEEWKVEFPNLMFGTVPTQNTPPPSSICLKTWQNVKVSVKGYMNTCLYRHEPFISTDFCDLKKYTFSDIMTSQTQMDYLASFLKESPDFCSGCSLDYQR